MKKKVLFYSIIILFTSVVSLNALYISEEQFKKAESECFSNIEATKASVKKFPEGKIIKVSEADRYYVLDNPKYTGNHYFIKCDTSNKNFIKRCIYSVDGEAIEYKGEKYFYIESQLSETLRVILGEGKCYELLHCDTSTFAVYYYVSDIPKNAILEYDKENKTLKVLPQNEKLVKELLEIVKKKKSNKK